MADLYLVVPETKAIYGVNGVDSDKSYYREELMPRLERLEEILNDPNIVDAIIDAENAPLKSLSVKAVNALYTVYTNVASSFTDYTDMKRIFVGFMLKYHPDAYFLGEGDDSLSKLESKGYKQYSGYEPLPK